MFQAKHIAEHIPLKLIEIFARDPAAAVKPDGHRDLTRPLKTFETSAPDKFLISFTEVLQTLLLTTVAGG
jgi:hypothetical protein